MTRKKTTTATTATTATTQTVDLNALLARFDALEAENKSLKAELATRKDTAITPGKAVKSVYNQYAARYLEEAKRAYVKKNGKYRDWTIAAFVPNYFTALLSNIVKNYEIDASVVNIYGRILIIPNHKFDEIEISKGKTTTAFLSGEFGTILRALGLSQCANMGDKHVGDYWAMYETHIYTLLGRLMFRYNFTAADIDEFLSIVIREAVKPSDERNDTMVNIDAIRVYTEAPNETTD